MKPEGCVSRIALWRWWPYVYKCLGVLKVNKDRLEIKVLNMGEFGRVDDFKKDDVRTNKSGP